MRVLWKERGLPPSWWSERTPHELAFLFAAGTGGGECPDPTAVLRDLNHSRTAPPVVPPWLMTEVPRAHAPRP